MDSLCMSSTLYCSGKYWQLIHYSTVMLNTFVASSGCWQALATSSFVNPVWAIIPPFWIMNYTLCWNDEHGVTLKIKGLTQKLRTVLCTAINCNLLHIDVWEWRYTWGGGVIFGVYSLHVYIEIKEGKINPPV